MTTLLNTVAKSLVGTGRTLAGRKPVWRRGASRRGAILLIIMGLLAMFGLVTIAFVLNSNQFKRSSQVYARIEQKADPAKLTLDQAVRQAIRGSNSELSVLGRPHSLLEDMYGNDTLTGTISGLTAVAGGQLLEFDGPSYRCAGRVLTLTSGPAAGLSTPIVGISSTGRLQALALRDGTPANGNAYIINGAPFSGTGVGYNAGKLDAKDGNGREIALLPNMLNPPGSANEDYDAADTQNMLLGAVINSGGATQVMPSLHRPDLISYWMQQQGKAAFSELDADLQRLILLRPTPADHPIFCQRVNAAFNPASFAGPFDVDNDGDGVPDSIWVDLGMPVRAAADGRLYKPLFAILCVDLDGKLNVNAHGPSVAANAGQGWGAAEISLASAGLSSVASSRSGSTGTDNTAMCKNAWFEHPNAFGSPMDIAGTGTVSLDSAGRPTFTSMGQNLDNNPYAINLSRNAPRGTTRANLAFSPAELERVLRPYDIDSATLPDRLSQLVGSAKRNMVTTDGWDLPCPGLALPLALRSKVPNGIYPQHLTDLLTAKMGSAPSVATLRQLLPLEMLAGMKMDVNRPFGNGVDDDNNGIVDDDAEAASGTDTVTLYTKSGVSKTPKFNHLNVDTTSTEFGTYTDRQLHARYLYVLALLLSGDELKAKLGDEEACRMLAQWAVNVVDFRDRDSIMTKFAYTTNPFTAAGWNPDGTRVVWGCERPELLLTETFAFHDRRTEDLSWPPTNPTNKLCQDGDTNYDQKKRPIGSLFIELYNPNSDQTPLGGEFQKWDAVAKTYTSPTGVRLNKQVNDSGDPVWRMIICKTNNITRPLDPDDPDTTKQPTVERSIYFTRPTRTYGSDGRQYYPTSDMASLIAPVPPGKYMVVGSGDTTAVAGTHTTYVGDKTATSVRRIVLAPKVDPTLSKVTLYKTGTTAEDHIASVAVINYPRRLSVSEPLTGFPASDSLGVAYNEATAAGGYNTPYDTPFDLDSTKNTLITDANDKAALAKTGTTPGLRVVYLQRLANPTKAFSATDNPYLTVDSLPIDLTAFNGLTAPDGTGKQPDEPQFTRSATIDFTSRERGTTEKNNGVPADIWKQEPILPKAASLGTPASPAGTEKFKEPWALSLGYLNEVFGAPAGSGDPTSPFPWLTWNNRPYSSQLELMLVPALRSSKLLACPDTSATASSFGYDIPKAAVNAYTSAPWNNPGNRYYPHLLPFLESGSGATAGAQLFRIFDYLHVPSRFFGAQVQGNPDSFASGDHPFHPPFNKIPTYREPGRINLNTIYNEEVLNGLANGFYGAGFWSKFVRSRRSDANTDVLAANSSLPSLFARPFRTFAGGDLTPTATRPAREIDATIFRADPDDANRPLFSQVSTADASNTDRNPFFRYQGLARLGNMVTTRSNVYAIWITVGYFEVRSRAVDQYHPDGFELCGELGGDNANTVRHRAFYIFDRSIPVGFQRGVDNNIEKAILVRRYIE